MCAHRTPFCTRHLAPCIYRAMNSTSVCVSACIMCDVRVRGQMVLGSGAIYIYICMCACALSFLFFSFIIHRSLSSLFLSSLVNGGIPRRNAYHKRERGEGRRTAVWTLVPCAPCLYLISRRLEAPVIHTHTYIYIYIYIHTCIQCMCTQGRDAEPGAGERSTHKPAALDSTRLNSSPSHAKTVVSRRPCLGNTAVNRFSAPPAVSHRGDGSARGTDRPTGRLQRVHRPGSRAEKLESRATMGCARLNMLASVGCCAWSGARAREEVARHCERPEH